MLNLNDVYLFARMVEHGGVAPAARALGLAKSSLSDRLKALETELGVKLVQRTSRRFGLTPSGRCLADHAQSIAQTALAGESAIRAMLERPAGELRLTASPATAASGLLRVLADFQRMHPAVTIKLRTTHAALDLVDQELDLAVRAHEDQLPDSSLVQRKLGFSRRVLVASPEYLRVRRAPERAEELESHARLAYAPPGMREPRWKLARDDGCSYTLGHRGQTVADDVPSLRLLALAGAGIAELPLGLCDADLQRGALRRVLPDWHAGGSHISLLVPARTGQPGSVRALSAHLVRLLPDAMRLERQRGG